ncbi:variable surface protein [Plasmodium gonderi]|uniref:Variable surface protein n=1 Tax=Plasmodium gonderi TaxID=77519 RepID=A0A1Y1JNR7_PLAGO|nr:variable surface protein [Plasmodium gonderi]GAW83900.1 variable surface protein [Plasmodium gonderi]
MVEGIYTIVKHFPEYNNIIEKHKHTKFDHDFSSKCKGILNKFPGEFGISYVPMCFQAMSYLYDILVSENSISTGHVCKYLYYWIYHSLINENTKSYAKQLYRSVLNEWDSSFIFKACINYPENISENVLKNMKHIYDMRNKINDIKNFTTKSCFRNICLCFQECADMYSKKVNECISNDNSDFCSALKNIKTELQELNSKHKCQIYMPEFALSFQINKIRVSIIITFLIMCVACIFTFIVYKYTPYSSWLRGTIKTVTNKMKNIFEEKNILHNFEGYNIDLDDKRYSILYYSP